MFDSKYTCEAQHGKMGQTRLTGRAAFAWEGKPPLCGLARLHQSLSGLLAWVPDRDRHVSLEDSLACISPCPVRLRQSLSVGG